MKSILNFQHYAITPMDRLKLLHNLSSVLALSTICNNNKMYLSVNWVDSAMLFMILLKDLPAMNGCVHMFLYQLVEPLRETQALYT